jgi:hypothetical protein
LSFRSNLMRFAIAVSPCRKAEPVTIYLSIIGK